MATFGEILANFKKAASSEPENIVPLMSDDSLMNGLIAWKSVIVTFKNAGDCPHQQESQKWQWLWDNIEFDSAAFATVAGVRMQDASCMLTRLKGLKLIYPDGTINEMSRQYLQSLILAKIKSVSRGMPKSKPEPKTQEPPVPPANT